MTQIEKISSFFEKDHARLDRLFHEFLETRGKDLPKAKDSFFVFKEGLLKHIDWEENLLFPAFESKTGFQGEGPTAVMRFEHEQIKKALHHIASALDRGNSGDDNAEEILAEVLIQHNIKEENILYPAIDSLLSEDETRAVFHRMQAIKSDGGFCCGLH